MQTSIKAEGEGLVWEVTSGGTRGPGKGRGRGGQCRAHVGPVTTVRMRRTSFGGSGDCVDHPSEFLSCSDVSTVDVAYCSHCHWLRTAPKDSDPGDKGLCVCEPATRSPVAEKSPTKGCRPRGGHRGRAQAGHPRRCSAASRAGAASGPRGAPPCFQPAAALTQLCGSVHSKEAPALKSLSVCWRDLRGSL